MEENPNVGSICPGKFNTGKNTSACLIVMTKDSFILECACNDPGNCPIGACECDGQLRINEDCTLAKYYSLYTLYYL